MTEFFKAIYSLCSEILIVLKFRPEGRGTFSTPCFARSGEILFFAPPKKSIQKKGDPGGLPASRVPCASRKARRSRNSLRSNRARASSGLYCDARLRQTGGVGGNSKPTPKTRHRLPVCTHRVPQPLREQARTLSEAGLPAELCAPPEGRGTQGIGAADECTGVPFSLGTFSWAGKRKYLARTGETRS